MKKVILFVIDALASDILIPALEDERLPHFQSLVSHGTLRKECISIFPSITPAALSAIITGEYPVNTGVPGDYWYDESTDTIHYIGGDFSAIMGDGLEAFFEDFLFNLNERFLKAPTLFETLEQKQKATACLNLFIHQGINEYEIELPKPMNLLPTSTTSQTVKGPSMLQLGDLHKIELDDFDFSGVEGIGNRFGFQDDTTMEILSHLIKSSQLPDFTVAYLPDNDWDSHELGPDNAVFTLEHIDEWFGKLFALMGGIDAFLDQHTVFIVGDHSQSPLVPDDNQRGINLNQVLKDFNLIDAGKSWDKDNEIIACPNLRSTLVYFNTVNKERCEHVVQRLLEDDRIDQVIWRKSLLESGADGYFVETKAHGKLYFYHDSDSPMAQDIHGNSWSWDGNLAVVDGKVTDRNIITFETYPNAFERLQNVLDLERSGDMWATAKPGYTFHLDKMDYEKRGSHGTLHQLDSTTSLLIAGHDTNLDIPEFPRIVDVAPMIMQVLTN